MSVYYWNGVDEVPLDVEDVVVNDGIDKIPDFTFASRSLMTSISLPDSLTTIGNYAFCDCDALETITLPKNLKGIGDGALCFSGGLKSISVDSQNKKFRSRNGLLYNKALTKLLQYPVGREDADVSILPSVTEVAEYAFNDCASIKKLTVGNNVNYIGNYAFSGCENLESIVFNEKIQGIGYCTFYNCKNLKSVTLPKRIQSIGHKAFGFWDMGQLVPDFWIRGYKNTEAQAYAKEHNIKFIEIFEPIVPTGLVWSKYIEYPGVKPNIQKLLPDEATVLCEITAEIDGSRVVLEDTVDYTSREAGGGIVVTFNNTATVRSIKEDQAVRFVYGYEPGVRTVNAGEEQECTVFVLPANATYRTTAWASSDTDYLIAGGDKVTGVSVKKEDGDYVPADVTLTVICYGGYSITSSWRVIRKVTEIQMSEVPTLTAGKLVRLTASLHPNDAAENNVTTTREIRWSVVNEDGEADTSVIEIYKPSNKKSELNYKTDPTLTATCTLIPKRPGTATIRASADGVVGETTVTVPKPGKDSPQIVIRGSANGLTSGSTYNVDLFLKNNPGIVGLNLKLKYDQRYLRLNKVENMKSDDKDIFTNQYHCNVFLQNPYPLSWASNIADENVEFSGKLATIIFRLDTTVTSDMALPVYVLYDEENLDIYDVNLTPVEFAVTNSTIKVTDIIYGDVDSDGAVDDDDVQKISRYLAEWGGDANMIHTTPQHGKPYTEAEAADLTNDDMINHRDQVILARYVDSGKTYTTTTEESVHADTEITLPDDAIDKIPGSQGQQDIMPLVSITTMTENYVKLSSKPNGWDKNYKSYYTYDSENETYEPVSGDKAPTWEANKYYEKKETKTTLKAKTASGSTATKYDYEVNSTPDEPSTDGKKIKFHESDDVPVDSDIEVTITYRIYSKWKGTDYELIPFDS